MPNKPYPMCSILICNTTVYDAQDRLENGELSLLNDTFTIANASATLAISGAAVYLGTADTDLYQYAPRFLEDHLQSDLTDARNRFGDNSVRFSAAWAQALSSRLTGWSAGSIELIPSPAHHTQAVLALSIPLRLAYVFVGLQFVLAGLMIILGITCLLLPGVRWRHGSGGSRREDGLVRFGTQSQSSGLFHAQNVLSDPTRLIHELIASKTQAGFTSRRTSWVDEPLLSDHPSPSAEKTHSLSIGSGSRRERMEGEEWRVELRSEAGGRVELGFRWTLESIFRTSSQFSKIDNIKRQYWNRFFFYNTLISHLNQSNTIIQPKLSSQWAWPLFNVSYTDWFTRFLISLCHISVFYFICWW